MNDGARNIRIAFYQAYRDFEIFSEEHSCAVKLQAGANYIWTNISIEIVLQEI